ncbi:Secreted effector protein PipB2 [termite gut metagenome]|uniref:Secreted effector protein PipB2 n=1 Tax=termite gut metagenome TaxID=433724 RepID=A0A5J4RNF7_9ZZZZ
MRLSNLNARQCRFQIIVSDRDVIVQQNEVDFRTEGQVLRLLPYYLNEDEKKQYMGNNTLLNYDQRNDWWKKYGQISEKRYAGLPEKLKTNEIDKITSEPLLNYLVALTYEGGKLVFSKNTNLNKIYADLLDGVYSRTYSEKRIHKLINQMDFEDFQTIFEEIALSAWHGKGRTTTIAEIHSHFQHSGLTPLLSKFIKNAEQGVVSLLAAFYFRQAGYSMKGSETFEFTHKSFGEYLTAKRIVRQFDYIHEQLTIKEKAPHKPGGWDMKQCLVEWIKIFGIKTLDPDIIKFIQSKIQIIGRESKDNLITWQETVVKLWEHVLKESMPMENLNPRPTTFKEENEQGINSEKALLIMHSLIANITNKVSDVAWIDNTSFSDFITRLVGQRKQEEFFVGYYCNHLNLRLSNLSRSNLWGANFYSSDLREAYLVGVNLAGANLNGANLKMAHLKGANLEEAHLERAYLKRAHLKGAHLKGAHLEKVQKKWIDQNKVDITSVIWEE